MDAMNPLPAISLSGMAAAQFGMQAGAHNIANLGTAGFRREQVVQTEDVAGGVSTGLTRAAEAGEAMTTDMVGLLQSKNLFLANLAVFRASDRMAGALLDAAA